MSNITFKSRNGEFTSETAPDDLLKWYAKQQNPAVRLQREAADLILKERSSRGISVSNEKTKSERPEPPKEQKVTAIVQRPTGAIQPFVSTEASFLNQQLILASQHCHLITPTTVFSELPAGFSAQLTLVEINKAEDCVPIEGAMMLTAATLKRVNTAAGISWNLEHTKRTDDNSLRNYWSYRAVGRYIDIDGNYRELSGEYEFDVRDDSARVEQIWAKARTGAVGDTDEEFNKLDSSNRNSDDLWNELFDKALERRNQAAKKEIDGLRKAGLSRAETGAKCRVTSELLKRSERGPHAWAKPIACLRLIKTKDPAIASQQLYPTSSESPIIDGTPEDYDSEMVK